jgi:uncharacterized Zn finger protein (UPF0148 family)
MEKITINECPECKKISFSKDWVGGEVGCEDCGSHSALQCPLCQKWIDLIFHDIKEINISCLLKFYNSTKEEIIEELAELEHNQWAHWTKYMLNRITEDNIVKWGKQIQTKYGLLSEQEKESDREWANKVYDVLIQGFTTIKDESWLYSLPSININRIRRWIKEHEGVYHETEKS